MYMDSTVNTTKAPACMHACIVAFLVRTGRKSQESILETSIAARSPKTSCMQGGTIAGLECLECSGAALATQMETHHRSRPVGSENHVCVPPFGLHLPLDYCLHRCLHRYLLR
jgi:hypothetical protein